MPKVLNDSAEEERRQLRASLRRRLAETAGIDPDTAVLVTIELERPDGQRVSSTCAVPGDLLKLHQCEARYRAECKVAVGFGDGYSRVMRLPS